MFCTCVFHLLFYPLFIHPLVCFYIFLCVPTVQLCQSNCASRRKIGAKLQVFRAKRRGIPVHRILEHFRPSNVAREIRGISGTRWTLEWVNIPRRGKARARSRHRRVPIRNDVRLFCRRKLSTRRSSWGRGREGGARDKLRERIAINLAFCSVISVTVIRRVLHPRRN